MRIYKNSGDERPDSSSCKFNRCTCSTTPNRRPINYKKEWFLIKQMLEVAIKDAQLQQTIEWVLDHDDKRYEHQIHKLALKMVLDEMNERDGGKNE